ncbi:MAG TPA: efflux RND transporter periplasmic adaptor subunit, partial [Methylomirabilota bacterium]|nr:efflux RND transporter periplasmic adaptor subunit [Methylomirabilota bacterium]
MKRTVMAVGVVGLAALIFGGYLLGQGSGTTTKYRVAPVERGPLTVEVSASGTLMPVVAVQVGSQLSGQIKAIYVDFNSRVEKNQQIALIAPEIFESKVNQARGELQNAEAAVLNQQALVLRAKADVENARGALAVGQAQTAKAQVAVLDAKRDLERKCALLSKDLIGRVDHDTAEALYESTVAQAQSARAQERVLSAAISGAEAQLEAAQASHQSSLATVRQKQAALVQAQVDLGNTVIRAPVDGIVVSRSVDVGQTVAASLQSPTLFTIAQDLSRMQVETNVVEADIGRLKSGQRATFTVDAFPGKTFRGEVLQLRQAPQVTQGVVSYTVVVSAQNPDQQLLPGMTANVRIIAAEKTDVLKVPTAALRVRIPGDSTREERERPKPAGGGERRPDRPGVSGRVHVVAPDGSLVPVTLQLGVSDGNATEVLGGDLKEGQQVAVGLTERRPA